MIWYNYFIINQKANTMSEAKLYTKQELEIELLKHKNEAFYETLKRLESKIDSHFTLLIGLILTSMFLPVIFHALKWM